MQREDFQIGTVFWSADRPHFPFRVALVGEGAIVAIMIDEERAGLDFFNGPLETYVQHEFIEEDFAGCTLERVIDPAKGNWPARNMERSSMVERCAVNADVAGSSPAVPATQLDMFGPNREPLRGAHGQAPQG